MLWGAVLALHSPIHLLLCHVLAAEGRALSVPLYVLVLPWH